MKTYPSFKMFAVLENNIVIDYGFGNVKNVTSPLTHKIYNNKKYNLIEVTEDNSPFIIGSIYTEKEQSNA